MNIAETPKIFNHPLYDSVRIIIDELNEQNLIRNGAGFCWAMADLLYHRLENLKIKSTIIECELTIIGTEPMTFTVVGHKNGTNRNGDANNPNKISTHVVVLVDHETEPLLIDCSVSHLLPTPFTWVCGVANSLDTLAEFHRGSWHLTYREKTGDQFPAIHQKSVIDRIYLDKKIDSIIEQFRLFRKFAIGLVTLVFLVFVYDFYITTDAGSISRQNTIAIGHIKEREDRQYERMRELRDQFIELQQIIINRQK